MKGLLLIIFFVISGTLLAQKSNNYIRWEGVSKEGHIIYGVSYTKEEAQFVIDDFNVRNAKTKFKIVYQTLRKRTTEDADLIRNFYDTYERKYRVLKRIDLTSLHIFQIGSFEKAVDFLHKNTDKSKIDAEKHMHQLLKEYQSYRLEERDI